MSRRLVSALLVTFALAVMIHLDWHFARPAHHRLSLGLAWHWLIAIPVFALVAWYVERVWPGQVLRASIAILGAAAVVAGVLEPAWELLVGGATLEWTFGAARTSALAVFVGTGVAAFLVTLAVMRRTRTPTHIDSPATRP